MIDLPVAPNAPTKIVQTSTLTSASLTWSLVSDTTAPAGIITGYRLYQRQPSVSSVWTLVFDGNGLPFTNAFTATHLTSSSQYQFAVSALNFNGEGSKSPVLLVNTCIPPSGSPKPTLTTSTTTSITISWSNPANDGGCAIQGFAIFRDDGQGGPITTEVDSASVRNLPSLHSYQITTFPLSSIGKLFRFTIMTINVEGNAVSESSGFYLGSVPSQPSTAPIEVSSSSQKIVV